MVEDGTLTCTAQSVPGKKLVNRDMSSNIWRDVTYRYWQTRSQSDLRKPTAPLLASRLRY